MSQPETYGDALFLVIAFSGIIVTVLIMAVMGLENWCKGK